MYGTVVGRIGKITSSMVNEKFCLNISVVEEKYNKNGNIDTWYQCSYWGKRAEGIEQHLFKGQSVSIFGQSYMTEYEGKQYLKLDAQDIKLQSWPTNEEKKTSENNGGQQGYNNSYNSGNNSGNNSYNPGPQSHKQWTDDIPI